MSRALHNLGRTDEALPLAAKAVSLDPSSFPAMDTLAALLERAGQCEEALRFQRLAVALLAEEEDRAKLTAEYRERLQGLESRCAAGGH